MACGRNARPVILHDDLDARRASRRSGDAHARRRRREGARIVHEVADHLAEALVVPEHEIARRGPRIAARRRAGSSRLSSRRTSLATETTVSSRRTMSTGSLSARASSASRREASEMSLISRSSRRTSCWITPQQPRRDSRRLRAQRHRLDGAAQRGQRVLQLVRDVGREALDRLDAVVERPRHVAQRAREMADLVRAVGEIRDFLARLDAPPHPLGRRRRAGGSARRWCPRAAPTARSSRRPPRGRCAGWPSARRR